MPITEAQKKASLNYIKEHYDQICIKVKKGTRERIRDRAANCNKSMNEYISSLIYEDMDGTESPQYNPEIHMYLKFVRKLLRRESLWTDVGNTLARCLKDYEITEDDYCTIICASGVDRNKFDSKMRSAGIAVPSTRHTIK